MVVSSPEKVETLKTSYHVMPGKIRTPMRSVTTTQETRTPLRTHATPVRHVTPVR